MKIGEEGPYEEIASRPNIVFVLTDDFAWNLVQFMPHVKAMERAGETFTRYFATDSLCCPSRASIFTGMFPHDTKIYSNTPPNGGFWRFHRRGEQYDTFATALQDVGYRTALMGKYLNGYRPPAREGGQIPYVPPGWSEWDVAGNGYQEFDYKMNEDGHVRLYGYQPDEYLTDVVAGKALDFIDSSASLGQPFMLEVATFAPHSPYTPAPRDATDFPGLRAPRNPSFNVANIHAPHWLARFRHLGPQKVKLIDRDFRRRAQAVQAVDRMVGQIEERVNALGLGSNTYIVFSSDNGLHMGEHDMMPGKLTAFDSDIRVPLVVVGPGVPAGKLVGEISENIDLCPTFEQLAGAETSPTVDGHSLVPLLEGQAGEGWRKVALVEHHKPLTEVGDPDRPIHGSGNPPTYEALRGKEFLYVHYRGGQQEYYNLAKDPYEQNNIIAKLPESRLRSLHAEAKRLKRCHGEEECWRDAGGT